MKFREYHYCFLYCNHGYGHFSAIFFFLKQWNESFLNGLTEKNDQTTIAKAYKDSSVSSLVSILYY